MTLHDSPYRESRLTLNSESRIVGFRMGSGLSFKSQLTLLGLCVYNSSSKRGQRAWLSHQRPSHSPKALTKSPFKLIPSEGNAFLNYICLRGLPCQNRSKTLCFRLCWLALGLLVTLVQAHKALSKVFCSLNTTLYFMRHFCQTSLSMFSHKKPRW